MAISAASLDFLLFFFFFFFLLKTTTSSAFALQSSGADARTNRAVPSITTNKKYTLLPIPQDHSRWPSGSVITYAFQLSSSSSSSPAPAPSMPAAAHDPHDASASAAAMPSPLIGVSVPQIVKTVRDAFAVWSAAVPFTFRQVDFRLLADELPDADIVFDFVPLHPGVLGSTRPLWNEFDARPYRCTIHFSSQTKFWADDAIVDDQQQQHERRHHRHRSFRIFHRHHRPDWYDLQAIALHEIGHALGLNHSSSPAAIMYPSVRRGRIQHTLHPDDIAGAQSIYGAAQPLLPPPFSAAAGERNRVPTILLQLFLVAVLCVSALGLPR